MRSVSISNENLVGIAQEYISMGKTFTFRAKGFSMRPFIENDRDFITIKAINAPIRVGDAILAKTTYDTYVIHRVVDVSDTEVILRGDGNISTETAKKENAIAIVTKIRRKGRKKEDTTSGLKWKVYSYFWMHTLRIRPYLLAICRRLYFNKKTNTSNNN